MWIFVVNWPIDGKWAVRTNNIDWFWTYASNFDVGLNMLMFLTELQRIQILMSSNGVNFNIKKKVCVITAFIF